MNAPPGLWLLRRDCAADSEALAPAGVTIEPSDAAQALVLVATVPLSNEAWRPLDEGEVVAVSVGQVIGTSLPSSRSQT